MLLTKPRCWSTTATKPSIQACGCPCGMTRFPIHDLRIFRPNRPGRVRANNEDAVAVDREAQVAVLADGMGGYNAGEIASGWHFTYIGTEMSRWLAQAGTTPLPRMCGGRWVVCGKRQPCHFGRFAVQPAVLRHGHHVGGGRFQCDRLILGHIGDSRCYRLRAGCAANHARPFLVAGTGRCRHIDREQAAASSNRNLVYPRVGCRAVCANGSERISSGASDLFVMCSDGLTDMVNDEESWQTLLCAPGSLEEKQGCSLTRPMPRRS